MWTLTAMAVAAPLDDAEQAALEALHANVERVRQVSFPMPRARSMTVAELYDHEVESLAEWMTPDDWRRASLTLQALDLAKPGFDLKHALLDLLVDHVQGFYDPDEHELVIVERANALPWLQIAGHELCHAQQLTRFEAWPTRAPRLANDDVVAAFDGLLEGEAMLVEMALVDVDPHTSDLRAVLPGFWPHAPLLQQSGVPSALLESVSYAYTFGAEFAQAVLQAEGWAGFDRAFERPPLSTEQVLHPEKYLGSDHDWPQRVRLDVEVPGFMAVETNTLGELGIATMLRQWGQRDLAFAVAAGWDGDRLVVFAREAARRGGVDVALVWRSVWDDDVQAASFVEALQLQWSGPHVVIEARGAEVVVLRGVPEAHHADVLTQAWEHRPRTVRRPRALVDRRALRKWRREERKKTQED